MNDVNDLVPRLDLTPDLDTIEFEELVAQARGDIPRYAPEWTDHNLHDPGMTLIDLLAWIVDAQVYRTGFVGGRHLRAFASLLGRRPEPPQPATGLIWPDRTINQALSLPAGTRVACEHHVDLAFALACDIDLSPAALVGAHVTVGGVTSDAPTAVRGSWTLGAGGRLADSALLLHFDRPLSSPATTAKVALGIELAPPPGPPPPGTGDRWGPVVYSYRLGQRPWVRLTVDDGTGGLAATGLVVLEVPPAPAGYRGGAQLRLAFDEGFFPVAPQLRGASINVLPVLQVQLEPPGHLSPEFDRGNGQPDQLIRFDTRGLVPPLSRPGGPALEVVVDNETWQPQPDFARSLPDDPHYVVLADRILFGNGVNGRRPRPGHEISHTGLARTAGASGNVRAGLHWSVPALGATGNRYGTNRQPLNGGRDATGLAQLVAGAREAAINRRALVTDADLTAAAYALPGLAVARAEVLPRFDHRLPGLRVDGVRTLVVLPDQRDAAPDRPLEPTAAYLERVAEALRPRRVLGERLIVLGPTLVAVDVDITLELEPGRLPGEVEARVEAAIRARLSVVGGAAGPAWPLGRDLTSLDVARAAVAVAGVTSVGAVAVAVAGDPTPADPIPVPRDGLVVARQVRVRIAAGPPGAAPAGRPGSAGGRSA